MYNHKSFDEQVEEMKRFGNILMPYNFPQVPQEEEEDVNFIKAREVMVDGYSLILHYSKADYGNHYLETLQVLGKYIPFLPFSLVCKIGKRFLGNKHLSLVELFRDNRKIYCWTLVSNRAGKAVPGPYQNEVETCIYEGFEYRSVSPKQVNFY
jgi:hypothetical protein